MTLKTVSKWIVVNFILATFFLITLENSSVAEKDTRSSKYKKYARDDGDEYEDDDREEDDDKEDDDDDDDEDDYRKRKKITQKKKMTKKGKKKKGTKKNMLSTFGENFLGYAQRAVEHKVNQAGEEVVHNGIKKGEKMVRRGERI